MSPLPPTVTAGTVVPDVMPEASRQAALPTGMRSLICATKSRVRLISLAPHLTRPSSPVSGTSGNPAAVESSPTAMFHLLSLCVDPSAVAYPSVHPATSGPVNRSLDMERVRRDEVMLGHTRRTPPHKIVSTTTFTIRIGDCLGAVMPHPEAFDHMLVFVLLTTRPGICNVVGKHRDFGVSTQERPADEPHFSYK